MDTETKQVYDNHAKKLAEQYESADMKELNNLLLRYLPEGGELLEIGCGSGRDAAFLMERGYHVTAVDPSIAMVRYAAAKHPTLAETLHTKEFPLAQDDELLKRRFDGVLCLAVLMHVLNHDLFEMARQTGVLLKQGGTLVVSFSTNREDLHGNRDNLGRLYIERPMGQIQLLFERLGFRLITHRKESDSLSRNIVWHILVMENATTSPGQRSVDQIESVISKDKKDATYKLALLRALCAIAQTERQAVSWTDDGVVEVPLGLIAEKWLFYYWPIVALDRDDGKVVMPQKRGMEERKPIAFRKTMRTLIRAYGDRGLNAIYSDYKSATVPEDLGILLNQTIRSIANTIVKGPVAYTGGGSNPCFEYVGSNKKRGRCVEPRITCKCLGRVRVPTGIWREMCLIGQWIGESLILRWAELTCEITNGRVTIQRAIDRLLEQPDPARDVKLARQIYETISGLTCVWTDEPLHMDWAVDHAVPFSVWHNNDLWNLFPCSRKANAQKSNKIVTIDFLHKRRQSVIQCWELLRSHAEDRFSIEISRSLLHDSGMSNWQSRAFNGLVENLETVAVQRGCERWAPSPNVDQSYRNHITPSKTNVQREKWQIIPFSELSPSELFVTALPLVGNLAAGPMSAGFDAYAIPEKLTDKRDPLTEYDWVRVPPKLAKPRRFLVRISGESMQPTLDVGDIVVFDYHRKPRQSGQIVVVADFSYGDECAVKRYREDKRDWVFTSDNKNYKEIRIPRVEQNYPILGVMVAKL